MGSAFAVVVVLLAGVGVFIGSIPSPPKAIKRDQKVKLLCNTAPRVEVGESETRGDGSGGGGGGGTGNARKEVTKELMAAIELVFTDKAIMSMLGVTILANFNYWSHTPLLQVLATRLEASPSQTGLLLSASGWGGLVASVLVTATNPRRSGMLYCLGIMFADAVLPLATIPDFGVAFAALVMSGFLAGTLPHVLSIVMFLHPPHRFFPTGRPHSYLSSVPCSCIAAKDICGGVGKSDDVPLLTFGYHFPSRTLFCAMP